MEVKYHAEQKFSPTALEILSHAKEIVFGDREITFNPVDTPARDVLCFGTAGGIRTLSPKQIATVPNAVSALVRSEEHTSELQSRGHLVCRLLLEKKKTR